MFKKLSEIVEIAKSKTTQRIVVAAAADEDVLEALKNAQELGIVVPVLVGDAAMIKEIAAKIGLDLSNIELYDYPDKNEASDMAVQLIREG
ncbi:MAG: phosphate acyltransferase, partial [Bacteroidales bacterium]|nr:phosphate acyltransferase [Bacteroidales bacterium]